MNKNNYRYRIMIKLKKLSKGDKVAILSPSFAAPGVWPHVYELGLSRLKDDFGLMPVEYQTTRKVGSSTIERAEDLVRAFEDPEIKAVITTIGGDDQVTYIKNLLKDSFVKNPKPFFGFSDNSHMCNYLFLNNIPSYYGGSIFTQYAMQGEMDEYTVNYLKHALFEEGDLELVPSTTYNDTGLDWADESLLASKRIHEESQGWFWDGDKNTEGLLWGGCLESVDEMLRHGTPIPTLDQFKDIVLMLETSEEVPTADYVFRVMRALGERGVLENVQGVLMGRPKAWEFNKQKNTEEKAEYRKSHREAVLRVVRTYNRDVPIIQNMNFGHTDPQIPMPYGNKVRILGGENKIYARF